MGGCPGVGLSAGALPDGSPGDGGTADGLRAGVAGAGLPSDTHSMSIVGVAVKWWPRLLTTLLKVANSTIATTREIPMYLLAPRNRSPEWHTAAVSQLIK